MSPNEPITQTVTVCIFKRKQKSKPERGIAIGQCSLIIDRNSRIVKVPVWSYYLLWSEGTLQITL